MVSRYTSRFSPGEYEYVMVVRCDAPPAQRRVTSLSPRRDDYLQATHQRRHRKEPHEASISATTLKRSTETKETLHLCTFAHCIRSTRSICGG